MKNTLLDLLRYRRAVAGLLLGAAVLFSARIEAQELLKNGNFEAPFPVADPTTGWSLVFLDGKGGPGDFAIAGPSTEASTSGGGNGAHFRANHSGPAFAYFQQVVTNLTPGAVYRLDIAKMKTGFKFSDEGPSPKIKAYAALVSGTSSNGVNGYSTNTGPYSLSITCSSSRQISVELHYEKLSFGWGAETPDQYKSAQSSAYFDDFSLTLVP
jgi:hypothetical protein